MQLILLVHKRVYQRTKDCICGHFLDAVLKWTLFLDWRIIRKRTPRWMSREWTVRPLSTQELAPEDAQEFALAALHKGVYGTMIAMTNNRFSFAKKWPAYEFCFFVIFSAVLTKTQQREVTKFQILLTTWTQDSKFTLLYLNTNTGHTDSLLGRLV